MGKRGVFEIKFFAYDGSRGGQGTPRSFRATLSKGTLSEAQRRCRNGKVFSVRKSKGD